MKNTVDRAGAQLAFREGPIRLGRVRYAAVVTLLIRQGRSA